MKLFSKNANAKIPHFWVENYTDKEKEFFLKLGFTENKSVIPEAFRCDGRGGDTLVFKGSGFLTMFSEEEYNTVTRAIFKELLPNRKRLTIYQDYEF